MAAGVANAGSPAPHGTVTVLRIVRKVLNGTAIDLLLEAGPRLADLDARYQPKTIRIQTCRRHRYRVRLRQI
jgi:hypothetical protein